MRLYTFTVAVIPLLYFTWIHIDPLGAARLAGSLKRRFRQYLIHKHGKVQAELLFNEIRDKFTKKGFDPNQIEKFIENNREQIAHRLGTQYADEFLGRPTWLEHIF